MCRFGGFVPVSAVSKNSSRRRTFSLAVSFTRGCCPIGFLYNNTQMEWLSVSSVWPGDTESCRRGQRRQWRSRMQTPARAPTFGFSCLNTQKVKNQIETCKLLIVLPRDK
uniref:Uncharacterized protein n=1 Tax=Ascaris lumbricoides TaxID=6252 RepID=A0A9J2Q062_ASCLU